MPERNKKEQDIIPMTPEAWRDQKLIALELRRRREKLRMTREELAEKQNERASGSCASGLQKV